MNMLKKYMYLLVLPCLMAATWLSGCTKDFTSINTDPNNIPNALPDQLLAPALVSTMTYNMVRNRGFNNELMQITVNQSDADATVFRYDFKDSYSDYLYNGWYSELTNFKDLYSIASEELTYNASYMGISLVCQAWIYSMLTDTYGDIPFSESNKGKTENILEPKFDKQKDIYDSLFVYLESADTLLKKGTGITAASDPVYNGDVTKWRKFGNSLYLRLLLRISGKAEVHDKVVAKIQDIISDPSTYPLMSSVADDAVLRWTGQGAFISPFVATRAQDFRSPSICSFFIDHLVAWNDPRINIPQYGASGVNRLGIAPVSGNYVGVASGYVSGGGEDKGSYFYATDQTVNSLTPPAITMQTDPMTGLIMNYAELQFILAECAVKGWIDQDPATLYNSGVESGIKYWLPDYDQSVEQYLADGDIQFNATGTEDEQLEQIGLQKYYVMLWADLEQWFEYRRTGHPVLPKGPGLKNGGVMPARMKYPIYVQATNPTNYKAAIAEQGPDEISTQVWWQKP
ncbi:Starch-binding associating with outer membrane [Arachidicoccus rhizosphaerae]|jgi:hypothetical protein|uniref:Starch-binding associating with outer membrane n=1 Tax=Arachidicoccus rhizosphaerae TaxID=551991 RepID=A0A1H3XH50_9BACT|nr:SusD/RagB family nutrient-binding outer membrane lipoprotein [Arachidicoccus rhizosphaerae]SDZ97952.1 Starch-binding associating with outer membrane [Arachidicoccus rhizosphaerae]